MRSRLFVRNPDELEITLTVEMTVREMRSFVKQLQNGKIGSYEVGQVKGLFVDAILKAETQIFVQQEKP